MQSRMFRGVECGLQRSVMFSDNICNFHDAVYLGTYLLSLIRVYESKLQLVIFCEYGFLILPLLIKDCVAVQPAPSSLVTLLNRSSLTHYVAVQPARSSPIMLLPNPLLSHQRHTSALQKVCIPNGIPLVSLGSCIMVIDLNWIDHNGRAIWGMCVLNRIGLAYIYFFAV